MVLETKIMPFYFMEIDKKMSYDHLKYLGCIGILSQGSTYKALEEIYHNTYGGLFFKGFNKTEFDNYMELDTTMFDDLLTVCQLDKTKLQFNAMNQDVLEYEIIKTGNVQYKDKIINYYRQRVMSPDEIKNNISENVPGFKELADFWKENREMKAISLTSVGVAIGILNYNIKTNSNISLSEYF